MVKIPVIHLPLPVLPALGYPVIACSCAEYTFGIGKESDSSTKGLAERKLQSFLACHVSRNSHTVYPNFCNSSKSRTCNALAIFSMVAAHAKAGYPRRRRSGPLRYAVGKGLIQP